MLVLLENNDLIYVIFGKVLFSYFIYCMDMWELCYVINLFLCNVIFEMYMFGFDIVFKIIFFYV